MSLLPCCKVLRVKKTKWCFEAYSLRSLMDVSSVPPTAAWENLQEQIQSHIQNQTETQYRVILRVCVAFCLLTTAILVFPQFPQSPPWCARQAGWRVSIAAACLARNARDANMMLSLQHRDQPIERVVETELDESNPAAALLYECCTWDGKLCFWEDKILCLNNPFPFFIAYLIIPSSIILLP